MLIGFGTSDGTAPRPLFLLAPSEERNFTRAAARVGIGQPALSQQIEHLKNEVSTALFRRIPQGAEATDAGRALLEA